MLLIIHCHKITLFFTKVVYINSSNYFHSDAANIIERVFRGHLGRKHAYGEALRKTEDQQISLFHYFSLQIQRHFRGYYSRKYIRNHATRKAYIQSVIDANTDVLDKMQLYSVEQNMVRFVILLLHHELIISIQYLYVYIFDKCTCI